MRAMQDMFVRRQQRCSPPIKVDRAWRAGLPDTSASAYNRRTPKERLYDEVCHALSVCLVEGLERADSADAD